LETRGVPGYDGAVSMPAASLRLALPRALTLVLAAALAVLPAVARAEDMQRAKEYFQQGTTYFNLGDFDKAIDAFQEAYKAKPDPLFLYNIGQAYRLKGDASKAIFFYRGYLRNSPKAPNRAEIEAKIAALQKDLNEGKASTPAPPPVTPPSPTTPTPPPPAPPPVTPAPPPPGPQPVAPPPVVAPPLAGPGPAAPEAPAPMAEAPPPPPSENRPLDFWLGFGLNNWTSGLNIKGSAPVQFAWDLGAGYTFGNVFGGASFRLGVLLGHTSLDEGAGTTKNTIGFTSFLVEPTLRLRLADHRLYLAGSLGIGGQSVSNVKPTSVVLDPKQKVMMVNGSIGAFELRPALSLQLHITPGLVAFMSPAISTSPKPQYFYQSLGRFELIFGLAYYL
jgi:hypothetical protein